MKNSQAAGPQFNTGMIKTGTALTGGGLMLATVGMALTAIAVARGTMAWSRERNVAPTAMAAEQFGHLRHATAAGMHAWQEHAAAAGNGRTHGR